MDGARGQRSEIGRGALRRAGWVVGEGGGFDGGFGHERFSHENRRGAGETKEVTGWGRGLSTYDDELMGAG